MDHISDPLAMLLPPFQPFGSNCLPHVGNGDRWSLLICEDARLKVGDAKAAMNKIVAMKKEICELDKKSMQQVTDTQEEAGAGEVAEEVADVEAAPAK